MITSLIFISGVFSQGGIRSDQSILGQRNVITTAVPFLLITPDSRAAGMGDMGVATSTDANSIHWNPAKLAFSEDEGGISLSAAPWLRQLVPDMWLYYLSGYKKLDKRQTVAASLRYFTLGDIQFTDEVGNPLGNHKPNELALDLSYSRLLSEKFSLGIATRFIYSDLARGNIGSSGVEIRAGRALAADLGAIYKDKTKIAGKDWNYAIGANISNIGNKITYTTEANRDFIPINLRLGTYWDLAIDERNTIGFGVEFNKLLVPTTQYEFLQSSLGEDSLNKDGNRIITNRFIDDGPVLQGMLSSFGDAPGGFREEMREITTSIGVEYGYDEQFFLRGGYFYEHDTKGGRNYLTFGAGIKYQVFKIDLAYLQPIARRHPLQNTIRFSLAFDLSAFQKQNREVSPERI